MHHVLHVDTFNGPRRGLLAPRAEKRLAEQIDSPRRSAVGSTDWMALHRPVDLAIRMLNPYEL